MDKKQMMVTGKEQPMAFIRHKNGHTATAAPPSAPPVGPGVTESGPGYRLEFRRITKDEARELLKNSPQQRGVDEAWAGALDDTMAGGEWDCGPGRAPIALDQNGWVINGQHRLAAFIASKLDTCLFLFALGCKSSDIATFDADTKGRTVKLLHPGIANAPRDMARVKSYSRLLAGDARRKHTNAIQEKLYRKYRKACEWAAEAMPKGGSQGRAPYVAAWMYVFGADAEFANRYIGPWRTGTGSAPSLLVRLRDEALRTKANVSGTKIYSANIRATLKTLNVLAAMHQKKSPLPTRISDGIAGVCYFSSLLGDNVGKRWQGGDHLLGEE